MRAGRGFGGPAVAGVVSVLVLSVAGCSSGGSGGDDVASVSRNGSAPAGAGASARSGPGDLAGYVEAQRAWVACLRKEGVDVSDPDAKGRVDFGTTDRLALKKDPEFQKAQDKCAHLTVAIPDDVEKGLQPPLTADEKRKNLRYSECMQENGAPDFPDTGEDGRFGETVWDSMSASAKRAAQVCGPIIGAPTDTPAPRG